MNEVLLTDKHIIGELAAYIRGTATSNTAEMLKYEYAVMEHNAEDVRPVMPAVITLEEYRRQTQPRPKVKGKAWYNREPKRLVKLLSVVQKVARWCVKHSEAIVCVLITLCVVMLILAFAVMMTAEWLG